MSRKYTNKELRASLIAVDQVLFDILSNAYEYMEVIEQEVNKIKNKTDDTPISEQMLRQMNASAQTMSLINFLVHPAHETSKRYFPTLRSKIDEYKASSDKAFEIGFTVCYCETQCDPGKVKLKKIITAQMEKIKAEETQKKEESNKDVVQEERSI
jgi:hypothetical protein